MSEDKLKIAGKDFSSRLLVGTGKYKNEQVAVKAIEASGAEIVTVAIRRVAIDSKLREECILNYISPEKFTILPNTAGCFSASDAVRVARLGREMLSNSNLVKLEVLSDPHSLLPLMDETLEAAKELVSDGFEVMVYCTDEIDYALKLEDIGCCAVMPLAAPIGSGLGIQNKINLKIIRNQTKLPVIVDAGIGQASDATQAMELGCDGVLINTAIAKAKNPYEMAEAMKYAVISGRKSYLSGRINPNLFGSASSKN